MADIKRLIGTDGSLVKLFTDTTVVVNALGTVLPRTWYQLSVKGVTPDAKLANLAVGDYYFNPNNTPLTLTAATTTVLNQVKIIPLMDVSGWSLDLTADETETTVLADLFKKYRQGRSDASGNLELVFMKGETDNSRVDAATGGAFGAGNAFLNEITVDATGQSTVYATKRTDPVQLLAYLDQDNSSGGITLAMILTIQLMSFSISFKKSDVVMVSPKFRLTGASNPVLYRATAL